MHVWRFVYIAHISEDLPKKESEDSSFIPYDKDAVKEKIKEQMKEQFADGAIKLITLVTGTGLGSVSATLAGVAVGAVIGSILPGFGTAIGGAVGGVVTGIAGVAGGSLIGYGTGKIINKIRKKCASHIDSMHITKQ